MSKMFEKRTPEAVANQMAIVLMYMAECQFATLEGLPKRTSKSERARHESICKNAIDHLLDFRVDPNTRGCPRVREAMLARMPGDD